MLGWMMGLSEDCLPYICEGMSLVVAFEDLWGLNMFGGLPGVVAFWVPLPLD